MAIPRAIVYHDLAFDLRYLLHTLRPGDARTAGEAVARFERAFARRIGRDSAVAFPFARTAVHAALAAQRFPEGSEVILPPITIWPMVEIVVALQLRPVFVDIELRTLGFDLDALKRAITPRTRAVLSTPLFGVVPPMDALMTIAREHELFVIEDFSHALNARYGDRMLGAFGDVGVYSSSATKTLDTYGGGMAVTDDPSLAESLRERTAQLAATPYRRLRLKVLKDLVWNVATRRPPFTLAVHPLLRLLRRLGPDWERRLLGMRMRHQRLDSLPDSWFESLTELQAGAGLERLERLDAEDQKRRSNVARLREGVEGFAAVTPVELPPARNVYWQCVLLAPHAGRAVDILTRHGIDTGTTNLNLVSGLGLYPEFEMPCPNAERVKRDGLFIPAHHRLSEGDLRRVERGLAEVLASP